MKKKIVFVTDTMGYGGVEKIIVNTLLGMDYNKFDITLLVLYKKEDDEINILKIPKEVNIIFVFSNNVNDKYKRYIYSLFLFVPPMFTQRFLMKNSYDIVVTTKDMFTYPLRNVRCKKVMWVHGGLDNFKNQSTTISNMLKNLYKYKTYKKFNKIILLTNSAKKNFCEKIKLEDSCVVINNPINEKEILDYSREVILDYRFGTDLNLVCASRLSIEKGTFRLTKAASKLIKEGYKFNLLLIGDGPERGKIEKLITSDLEIKQRITMLGFRQNPYKYLKRSSVFISPSITEGFPTAIAEALLLDLPIISTNCNGSAEMLNNGEFGLLSDNSEEGIYTAIKNILENPDLVQFYKSRSTERKEFLEYKKIIGTLEENFIY